MKSTDYGPLKKKFNEVRKVYDEFMEKLEEAKDQAQELYCAKSKALDMYDRTGFVRWERRLVYLFTPR